MKGAKFFSWLFGLVGLCLMVGAAVLCFASLAAAPKIVEQSEHARLCAEEFLDAVCHGDFEAAQSRILGQPDLGLNREPETDVNRLIWDAFVDSLSGTLAGDSYATDTGPAWDMTVTFLDIAAVTDAMTAKAGEVLSQRQDQSGETLLDENGQYPETLVQEVLLEAAGLALEEATPVTRELTLNLVFQDDQWWISADKALLEVLSGGLAG